MKQYENDLNTKGIDYPVKLRDITKFESLNPALPGINLFSINEHNKFYPLRMAQRDAQQTIDLFLYEQDDQYHYSLIKNFSRLFRSQITSRTNGTIHTCKKCFTHFSKQETVAVRMPRRNTILRFNNYHKQLPIPFVVYADFEYFTKPMSTCSSNSDGSYTYSYQKHEPSGFCLYINIYKGLDGINATFKPIIHTKQLGERSEGEGDIAATFVSKLEGLKHKIYNDFYSRPKPLRLTKSEQEEFNKAELCHICKKTLNKDRVRDYCHFTGVYRGAAHNSCNLQCRKPMILPVIFHNLQGYDAHLFIKQLARLSGNLNCIPSTEEKYISFSKKIKVDEYKSRRNGETVSLSFEIRCIDSFKFLQTSLANLVGNLQLDVFHNTKAIFDNVELLTRKGVYPYDYVSSIERLSETQLPPKSEFYSKLND